MRLRAGGLRLPASWAALALVAALACVRADGAEEQRSAEAAGHESTTQETTAGSTRADSPATLRVLPVHVRAVHPHDPQAFTQGLVWIDGHLYESLGLRGRSALREVELASGQVVRETRLPAEEFGEGLGVRGDELVQLTWQEGIAHRWGRRDFAHRGTFRYDGDGWGLAWDPEGERWIQSDGSSTLRFREPASFRVTGELRVTRNGAPAAYLNELEWAEGALYANVWESAEILRIDPRTGQVTAAFDATGLLTPDEATHADVLNGIAWNPDSRRFYLTGKLWPKLFEVELSTGETTPEKRSPP